MSCEFFAEEVVSVDCNEEVAEMIGNLVAVFVFAVKCFAVVVVLKNGGEKFNDHSIAVTFVSAESFADSAERSKSSFALSDLFEGYACVAGYGFAVKADYGSGMNIFADSLVIFDLAVLGD